MELEVGISDFNNRLAVLMQESMKAAGDDHEQHAEMIERLIHAVAFTIAVAAGGQKKAMDTLLAGAEQHLYEDAAALKDVGSMMAGLKRQ